MSHATFKTQFSRSLAGAVIATSLVAVLLNGARGPTRPSAVVVIPSAGLRGPAQVVDGDTLIITGVRVRLEGIDAPESNQTCQTSDGRDWWCGREATRVLAELIGGAEVVCDNRGRDKYGRVLGICSAGSLELNAEMVRRGLAWAFVRYSQAYVGLEARARADRIGVWQGEAQPAWDFRASGSRANRLPASRLTESTTATPDGCTIKGNVTASGLIYHTPSSPWYEKIRIDLAKGKRWFCSETQALAAGWRPARAR